MSNKTVLAAVENAYDRCAEFLPAKSNGILGINHFLTLMACSASNIPNPPTVTTKEECCALFMRVLAVESDLKNFSIYSHQTHELHPDLDITDEQVLWCTENKLVHSMHHAVVHPSPRRSIAINRTVYIGDHKLVAVLEEVRIALLAVIEEAIIHNTDEFEL